ncbi:16S rRNA (cytosine967-C5)-methyltransferase [Marchantia polymorpha subsp. ruderalis]
MSSAAALCPQALTSATRSVWGNFQSCQVHMGIPLGAGRFGEGSGIDRLSTELGFCGFLGCTFRRAAGEQNGFKERSRKRGLATSASGNFDRRRPVEVSRRDSSRNAPSGERRQQRTKFRDDISPHRAVVVVRLLRIEEGGAYADILSWDSTIDTTREMQYVQRTLGFSTAELEPRGRRLVTEEVAGIVRWKRYLDYLIFSQFRGEERDYERMEPLLRQILRLGVYELVMLEMSPYAVVNEATQLAKIALRAGAGGMVNGLLRAVATNQIENNHPSPVLEGDDRSQARALATIHSHPVWMVRKWMARFGKEETIELLQYNNRRPTFALRANIAQGVSPEDLSAQLDKLEVAHEKSPYVPEFVRLSIGMQDVLRAGLLKDGLCAVQDESAGLVVCVVDPQPGEHIIDCCAAPGGKALFLAAKLNGTGKVLAVDINEGRLRILEEAAEQLGVSNIVSTLCCDLRNYTADVTGTADKVLLDAPCSGLGVLAKRADLRWRRTPEEILGLNDLQDQLLDSAAKLVKPGGVLVYSTCSIEPAENHERVAAFIDGHPEFVIESAEAFIPKELVSEEGYFASKPHKHLIDGAFAARLRKTQ